MGRIIILEGPDGGGKTTFAKALVTHEGFAYYHVGPPAPNENLLVSYANLITKARFTGMGNAVIDRFHLGESVYGPIFRNKDLLGEEGQTLLKRVINAYGAQVIMALPPYGVAKDNWQKRQETEMVTDLKTYDRIYEAYAAMLVNPVYTPLGIWDYTRIPLEVATGVVTSDLMSQRQLPKGVIGSITPRFLFVGEIANQIELDLPWMSLEGSSHFLYECLREAGFREQEMAFVNALTLNKQPIDLLQIWEELQRPSVVFLGRTAKALFTPPTGPCAELPHPAYWLRFQTKSRHQYVEKLGKFRKAAYGNAAGH